MPNALLLPHIPDELVRVLARANGQEDVFAAFIQCKVDPNKKVDGWPLSVWLTARLFEQALVCFDTPEKQSSVSALPLLRQVNAASRLLSSEYYPLCWMINATQIMSAFKLSSAPTGPEMSALCQRDAARSLGGFIPAVFLLAKEATPKEPRSDTFWKECIEAFGQLYAWSPLTCERLHPALSLGGHLRTEGLSDNFWEQLLVLPASAQAQFWTQLSANPGLSNPVMTMLEWHEKGLGHFVRHHANQPWPERELACAVELIRSADPSGSRFAESFHTYWHELIDTAKREHQAAGLHHQTVVASARPCAKRL